LVALRHFCIYELEKFFAFDLYQSTYTVN